LLLENLRPEKFVVLFAAENAIQILMNIAEHSLTMLGQYQLLLVKEYMRRKTKNSRRKKINIFP
jgi:hypothetical protein